MNNYKPRINHHYSIVKGRNVCPFIKVKAKSGSNSANNVVNGGSMYPIKKRGAPLRLNFCIFGSGGRI